MATDGLNLDEYDATMLPILAGQMVRVMRAFGFAGVHVVIIGGLVPSLLVPDPDSGLEPHVGTHDLDLCLSVALIEGEVGEYDRMENSLRAVGFAMVRRDDGTTESWRWRDRLGVTIEFFCPSGKQGRQPGRLFRPGGVVGGKLSALVLATGHLIDRDARDIELEVELPDNGGRTRQVLRVVGPAAYLASKVDALRGRDKNKDAYDIVWILECWPGGQPAIARTIVASAVFDELGPTLTALREEFATIDSAGAVKYGRFMARDTAAVDLASQRAVGAIAAFLGAMDDLFSLAGRGPPGGVSGR